jgi:ribosomal protein S18 acetylase RimI-like enzyme
MLSFREYAQQDDLQAVEEIIRSSGFFYEIEIPVALGLLEDYLEEGEESGYYFLFAVEEGHTVGYACYGEVAGTEGAYDLYWIAVHNDQRGKGFGKLLLEKTHEVIRLKGGRIVIAETSSLEKYHPTRNFYLTNGYAEEGFVKDFYKPGDGRLTYVKRL